MFSGEYD